MADDAFQRWQKIRIDQHGYAINLILGFSVAALGFTLAQGNSIADNAERGSAQWLWISAACFFLSTALGIHCSIIRLRDFRKTALIARIRQRMKTRKKTNSYIRRKLRKRRSDVKCLGQQTWALFYCQITFFGVGVIILALLLMKNSYHPARERSTHTMLELIHAL